MDCPWCHGGLQPVVLGIQDQVSTQWCPVCSFMQNPNASVGFPLVMSGPKANVLHSLNSLVAYEDVRGKQRWQWFEELMSRDIQGELIREAYDLARRQPGLWVATASWVDPSQWLRALIGLSCRPIEPRVAVRCRPDTHVVDLAFAEHVVREAELQPTLYQLLTPTLVYE